MDTSLIEKIEALRHVQVSRRTTLHGIGAAGLVAALAASGLRAFAHEAHQAETPAAGGAIPDIATEYPEVAIVARDFEFEMPNAIEANYVRVTFENQGDMDHHAFFMKLNEGVSWEGMEAILDTPDFGALLGAGISYGGPGGSGPGGRDAAVIALDPGQYAVICAIPDEEGNPHYTLGMRHSFEVTEPATAMEAPTADQTAELHDFEFHVMEMEGTVAAGPQIWAFPNMGQQIHEGVVVRLAEGMTFDQVMGMLGATEEATPEGEASTPAAAGPPATLDPPAGPPFAIVGGVAPMSPGMTNWAILDLTPGDYFLICFVPDPETEAPHFALGMVMPFTVA